MIWLVVSALAAPPAEPPPMHAHAAQHLDEALDRVNATPGQRNSASERLESFLRDMAAVRERGQAVREEVHDALFGVRVDRNALEAARVELTVLMDDGSALLFDFAADLAELFSPAQRKTLHELRHERLRDRWSGWSDRTHE